MRGLQKLSQVVSGKRALALLAVIIIVHLFLMVSYLHSNRVAREMVKREAVIQKIINAIFLVEATPVQNRAMAVAALDDPDLHVSLTSQPNWNLRFNKISFWEISKALRVHLNSFSISINLEHNQWLNLNATIYSHIFLKQLLLLLVEVFVLGSVLIAAWSINRFTQPLEQFKLAAEQLGIDLHSKPLDIIGGPRVVQEAAQAMNKMQKRIQDLIRDRTQMLAAISHDLRTPITRMKLRSQLIDDHVMQINLINDLDEMEKMVNDTLAFAREDCTHEKKIHVDLVSLLTTISNEMQDMGHDVSFHSRLNRVSIKGRPLALKRAFTNIINNGIRYGQKVEISLNHRRIGALAVTIDDYGPGIPEEEKERVFEPFYRSDSSRSRDTGGVGLGLAVTRDILLAHRAKIILQNRKPVGLRVIVEF